MNDSFGAIHSQRESESNISGINLSKASYRKRVCDCEEYCPGYGTKLHPIEWRNRMAAGQVRHAQDIDPSHGTSTLDATREVNCPKHGIKLHTIECHSRI